MSQFKIVYNKVKLATNRVDSCNKFSATTESSEVIIGVKNKYGFLNVQLPGVDFDTELLLKDGLLRKFRKGKNP